MRRYVPTGVEHAARILEDSEKLMVYYDPDGDGVVAGEFGRRFSVKRKKEHFVYINENRKHGLDLTEEQLAKLAGYTILLVDAGVTRAEVEWVTSRGVSIVTMDHHHIEETELVWVKNEETGCEGLILNNQYPFEPEEFRFLSGAGVTYCALKAIDPEVMGKEEYALVGLSLLTDIRPLDSELARSMLHACFTCDTPFFKYLIEVTAPKVDFGFGMRTFDRNYIDYTFSPRLNALFRLNRGQDAINLFMGNYSNYGQLDVYRNIQKEIVLRMEEKLVGYALPHFQMCSVPINLPLEYDYNITNFIGLACSGLAGRGKTTLFYAQEGGTIVRGSVRGISEGVDYLNMFRRYGFHCEGHLNAFGVMGCDVPLDKIALKELNEEIRAAELEYEKRKYDGRVMSVTNLALFIRGPHAHIARVNNYVRDNQRYYLHYTGDDVKRENRGKAIIYKVDGIEVLCFDESLTMENSFILPLEERGAYTVYYLKKR